jgi:hypothetical protein
MEEGREQASHDVPHVDGESPGLAVMLVTTNEGGFYRIGRMQVLS